MKRTIGFVVILITVLFLPSAGRLFSLKADSHGKSASKVQDPSQSAQDQTGSQDQEIPISPSLGTARVQVLVEMVEPPAARVYAQVMASSKLPKAQAHAAAITASKKQVETNKQRQQILSRTLTGSQFGAEEIYRVQKAYNGISVYVRASQIDALRALPGVKAVHIVEPEYPTTTSSVPFIGAPQLWANTLGLPAGADGAGIKIGIIDTGIDYQHPDFGGTGASADYAANNRTTNADGFFPTAKVVGGTDFCGDAYTGSNTPVPDNDPMDCLGHGTHVAGIAAGVGVNSDGTPYTGVYGPTTPFNTLRIGPGAAPKALLYALRVFGCGGSTGLTVQAIDWAMDPNGDNDMSDHLDVINMSLGSNFGSPTNTSAAASDNAALVGVIVVAAAGNAGDTYFIHSSPGSSARAMSVAASVDGGQGATFLNVDSPGAIAGLKACTIDVFAGPPHAPPAGGLTGNLVAALDPADGAGPLTTDACTALTNAAAVAGKIAFIDRGTCGFQVKAANAQAAGAIGVVIASNSAAALGNMAGAVGVPDITIPVFLISQADGNAIRTQMGLGTVNVTLYNGGDMLAQFSSRGPRLGAGFALKPDIAAPGSNITSAQTGITCTGASGSTGCITVNATGFLAGGQTLTISGTSMATPHMAGVMALLRQLHPTWTVEELKALAMNTATHDITDLPNAAGNRYGVGRVGAGRVDVPNAAVAQVIAFNAEEEGLVSLTFDTDVVGTATLVKKLKVVNQGAATATYDLAIDTTVDAPGVAFSLPGGSSVTLQPGQSTEIAVQLDATASLMDHTREVTVAATQGAAAPITTVLNRQWLTEEGGYVTFKVSGQLKLRVPVYAALRPTSTMSGPATIVTGGAGTGSTSIPLTGTGVCTGTLGAGPTCIGVAPTDVQSVVSPFELQVVSPRNTSIPAFADIQYVGVAYDSVNNVILFGVTTWGDWATPTDVAFNIFIDNNSDGVYDRVLFNSNPGSEDGGLFGTAGATATDAFINAVFTIATNGVTNVFTGASRYINRDPALIDSALFRNNVMILAASPATLGLATSTTPFRYKVSTTVGSTPLVAFAGSFDNAVGPFTWSTVTQGLNFNNGSILLPDLNGSAIPVTWNTANLTTNGSLGALLLHHFNAAGTRAQVVPLDTALRADLGITKTFSPPSPTLGQNVTFTVTVTNSGPNNATGVVVTDVTPVGLTYVSDDGGGAYSSATGQWTVGSLANGASATLHVVATLVTTDAIVNQAQITSASPVDSNPANNQAKVTINAPQSADLSLVMTVPAPAVAVGSSVTYTLKVTNIGDDPAYNVVVTESFPSFPALHATSAAASQGVFNSATGVWNIASLGKGVTDTLTITVTVPATCGSLTCQGTVTSDVSDPISGNNMSSAAVPVTDTVAPTITCPANITASTANLNDPCVVVNFAPVASDNCALASVVCVPPSGSCFATGVTTVNCTAKDTSNNTAACSFTVTVANVCLQDDTNSGTVFSGNAATGAYTFCCGGVTYSGIAQVTRRGNVVTFTHNPPDRRVTASIDGGLFKGTASIQTPPGVIKCTISDRDTRNNTCICQ